MNLSQLTAQFQGLMNRRDLNANPSLVSTFLNQGVMRVQRELRVPAMEKSVLVTIADPYNGLIIPNDLIELISITTTDDEYTRLDRVDIHKALRLSNWTGHPEVYCRQGGLWVIGPSPAIGDVLRIDYYAELPALVNPTDTNVMATVAWDLIVYAALSVAGDYYVDKRTQAWEARYTQIKEQVQEQSDADELGGTSAVQPCSSYPDDLLYNESSPIW
jgi:hypothetical protein